MTNLVALVIGNSNYENASTLKNPGNDAEDVAKKLSRSGFEVTKLIDADFKLMRSAVKKFANAASDGDVALLFFAGHGVQVEGVNYLLAVDTPLDSQTDVEHGALSLDEVIRRMEKANSTTNIIILDACRENPWERRWRGGPAGLAPVYAPRGTLIGFATSPGQVALDGTGRNGAYTAALLKHIDAPDLPIEAMFKRLRNTLSAATNKKQISWEHTSLAGEWYFNLSVASRIDIYGPAAIKDKIFALDDGRRSHRAIRGLKSYNWYTQNAALEALDIEKIRRSHDDNLFVLGRNILQAAHGSANASVQWIREFRDSTKSLEPGKRKAILDGILFEIFFDSNGEIREQTKSNCFNDVFDLQEYAELQSSFDFIASALAPESGRMFALPGKGISVSVDVKMNERDEVTGIFVGGNNYFGIPNDLDDEIIDLLGPGTSTAGIPTVAFRARSREVFEEDLSKSMLVPRRYLNVFYEKESEYVKHVRVPYGFEVGRPGQKILGS